MIKYAISDKSQVIVDFTHKYREVSHRFVKAPDGRYDRHAKNITITVCDITLTDIGDDHDPSFMVFTGSVSQSPDDVPNQSKGNVAAFYKAVAQMAMLTVPDDALATLRKFNQLCGTRMGKFATVSKLSDLPGKF